MGKRNSACHGAADVELGFGCVDMYKNALGEPVHLRPRWFHDGLLQVLHHPVLARGLAFVIVDRRRDALSSRGVQCLADKSRLDPRCLSSHQLWLCGNLLPREYP
jgi:hypothetical protein